MKTSWLAAGAFVIALSIWMATGLLNQEPATDSASESSEQPMAVQVQVLDLESIEREIALQGQLEPIRHLFLKAETSGTIQSINHEKGARVKQDEPILILDIGGRENSLAEAQARVKTARSEQEAAKSLRQQRLQSQLQLEQAEAALETALAQLAAVELDISKTTITAPFSGVINELPMDIGALVERGDVVAELLDDSEFNVSAQASQQSVSRLTIGQALTVKLITGQSLAGRLMYISALADSQTRSFKIEARIENIAGITAAGISASLIIPVEKIDATFVSPSAMSLGSDGELGVKAVDENDQVRFLPIQMVSTTLDGAWVTGIPADTRVITLGQGFVNVGETVTPNLANQGNSLTSTGSN